MWDQSSGSQFGQIIQSLMQQNPQVYQRLMQLMSQQRTAGIGSLQPGQGGGPMPFGGTPSVRFSPGTDPGGNNLLARLPAGGMPSMGPPPSYGGQPPQGGMWGMPRTALPQPMPAGGGDNQGYAWGPNAAGQRALMPAPTYGNSGSSPLGPPPVAGYGGNQGTGPTLPYAQRFNTNPGPSYPAIPMPTVTGGRSQTPYTPPPFVSPMLEWQTPQRPAPFSAPASQPKTYGASQPAGPSLAQNGTSGLDWYAMQAGN